MQASAAAASLSAAAALFPVADVCMGLLLVLVLRNGPFHLVALD